MTLPTINVYLLGVALLLCAPTSAFADVVTQPTGERVPSEPGCDSGRPTGLQATFACICEEAGVCNIGEVCASETSCDEGRNGTCEARMFHIFNDNSCIPSMSEGLDAREDPSLEPQTFSPTCALTFTVETRGTALFGNAFGWYNADTGGSPPEASDMHVMLACDAAPGTSVVLDVRTEPAYRGGEVGFFLLSPEENGGSAGAPAGTGSCAGGDCCASIDRLSAGQGFAYFSERALNPDERGADSFVHLLVYDSALSERKFYFAWEDTFNTANNDFTDLVTSVSGVECAGAGDDCDTGDQGACAIGITRCAGGTLECVARFSGETERCDGLDNDCDTLIDEEPNCPADQVCSNGACVPHCDLGAEFQCGLVRDQCDLESGLCVEPTCAGVECAGGEVCRDGACRGECDGITCPGGLRCFLDECIDPCASISCTGGTICRGGLCVPGCNQCDGLTCDGGEVCDATSGDCRHPDCPSSCAAGMFCDGPAGCRDACDGAICPRGEVCRVGACVNLREGEDGGVAVPDGGVPDGGVGVDGSVDGATRPDGGRGTSPSGACGCRVVGAGTDGGLPVAAAVLFGVLVVRVRRRR